MLKQPTVTCFECFALASPTRTKCLKERHVMPSTHRYGGISAVSISDWYNGKS